jgi:hypothetical protein
MCSFLSLSVYVHCWPFLCYIYYSIVFLHNECTYVRMPVSSAGILEQSAGARNREGIGVYRPVRLHMLTKSIPGIDSCIPYNFKMPPRFFAVVCCTVNIINSFVIFLDCFYFSCMLFSCPRRVNLYVNTISYLRAIHSPKFT